MKKFFLIALSAALAMPVTAGAEMKYYADPVYRKLNADDHHPMEEMFALAEQGDTQAQFIIGDMYRKGKGGLEKNLEKSREWLEKAAMHGNNSGFIRLAAMAKSADRPVEAWQWYTLAIDGFGSGDEQLYAIKARRELVETEKLTQEEISRARKNMAAWKEERGKRLRAEREEAVKQAAADALTERERLAAPGQQNYQQEKKNDQN